MAFIKQESEDMRIEEVFSLQNDSTGEQTGRGVFADVVTKGSVHCRETQGNKSIAASHDDGLLGRVTNGEKPNAKMVVIEMNGVPYHCLIAIENISKGQKIVYDDGGDDKRKQSQKSTSEGHDQAKCQDEPDKMETTVNSSHHQTCYKTCQIKLIPIKICNQTDASDPANREKSQDDIKEMETSVSSDCFNELHSKSLDRLQNSSPTGSADEKQRGEISSGGESASSPASDPKPEREQENSADEFSVSDETPPEEKVCDGSDSKNCAETDNKASNTKTNTDLLDSSSKTQESNTLALAHQNYCFVCGTMQSKIARHFKIHAKENLEIAKALRLPVRSKRRKQLLEVLRNRGNFNHNHDVLTKGEGTLKVKRRSSKLKGLAHNKYVHCLYCKGMFLRQILEKHLKRCRSRSTQTHEAANVDIALIKEKTPELKEKSHDEIRDCTDEDVDSDGDTSGAGPMELNLENQDGSKELNPQRFDRLQNSSPSASADESQGGETSSEGESAACPASDLKPDHEQENSALSDPADGFSVSDETPPEETVCDGSDSLDTETDKTASNTTTNTDLDSSSKTQESNTLATANQNYCFVCGTMRSKISRHFKVHAKENLEIAKALRLPVRSKKRKQLLEDLRNRGNFNHNHDVLTKGKGTLKVKRRSGKQTSLAHNKYKHCLYCKAMFVRQELWRHLKRCRSRPTQTRQATCDEIRDGSNESHPQNLERLRNYKNSANEFSVSDETPPEERVCDGSDPSSSKTQEPNTLATANQNYCFVCGTLQAKIARHFKVHVKENLEIAKALCLPVRSKRRKQLLEDLRNRGNFNHNHDVLTKGKGTLKVKRRSGKQTDITHNKYEHCLYCKGMYIRQELWRHVKRCRSRPTQTHEAANVQISPKKAKLPELRGKSPDGIRDCTDEHVDSDGDTSGAGPLELNLENQDCFDERHPQRVKRLQNCSPPASADKSQGGETSSGGESVSCPASDPKTDHEQENSALSGPADEFSVSDETPPEEKVCDGSDSLDTETDNTASNTTTNTDLLDSSSKTQKSNTLATANQNYCFVCGTIQSKIAQHFKVHAKENLEIAKALRLPVQSKRRKQLLEDLRNRGNVNHNHDVLTKGEGTLKVKRRSGKQTGLAHNKYEHCLHCKGMFLRQDLWRHMRRCRSRPTQTHEAVKKRKLPKLRGKSHNEIRDCADEDVDSDGDTSGARPMELNLENQDCFNERRPQCVKSLQNSSPSGSADESQGGETSSGGESVSYPASDPKPDHEQENSADEFSVSDETPSEETVCDGSGSKNCTETDNTESNTTTNTDLLDSSSKTQESNTLATANQNYCFVCGALQAKISRHFKVHAKENPEIAKALRLPVRSKRRKQLLEDLRNRGNFNHNHDVLTKGEGTLKVKRRSGKQTALAHNKYEHCLHCKGMFLRQELWRHVRRCRSRPTQTREAANVFITVKKGKLPKPRGKSHEEIRDCTDEDVDSDGDTSGVRPPELNLDNQDCSNVRHPQHIKRLRNSSLSASADESQGGETSSEGESASFPASDPKPDREQENSAHEFKTTPEETVCDGSVSMDCTETDNTASNTTTNTDLLDSSSKTQESNSLATANQNYCFVCGTMQSKIARHFKVHAKENPEIAKVLSLPVRSTTRKQLLEDLRNRGNFNHNHDVLTKGEGSLKVKRRSGKQTGLTHNKYEHCLYCKGMFLQQDLWRHARRCKSRPTHEATLDEIGDDFSGAMPLDLNLEFQDFFDELLLGCSSAPQATH